VKVTGPDGTNPITDKQLRDLRGALVYAHEPFEAFAAREKRDLVNAIDDALYGPNVYTTHSDYYEQKRAARAHCAEAWNDLYGGQS